MESSFTFCEFFAGGGMARIGLGERWRCVFANDIDPRKADTYRTNFGDDRLRVADVWTLSSDDIPAGIDLAWASSPCQDLSLAGRRDGLSGDSSSAFWGFWRLIEALGRHHRAPRIIVIENVVGLFTSNDGRDLQALFQALSDQGYEFGALEIDAAAFVPQSRPRLFVIAVRGGVSVERGQAGDSPFHSARVRRAHTRLEPRLKDRWIWWPLQHPPAHNADLASLLEPDNTVAWRTVEQTAALIEMLAPLHLARLRQAQSDGRRHVAAIFRRTRSEHGRRVQRAELRFDGVSGCLRTPGGGSSRQFLAVIEGGQVSTRHMTAREGARLMGLPDSYILPRGETAAFHVIGDGVACPVVSHLGRHLLEPLLTTALDFAAE